MTITQFKKETGIHITTRHSGKMSGMLSLSTSVLCNKYCQQRAADPATICCHCFASNLLARYKETAAATKRNHEILTREIIPADRWPIINARVFRLEAFGDIANDIQFINYINFANKNPKTTFALWTKNPKTTFALWTKNPGIIERVLNDGYSKPKNMIIIYSSPFLNKPVNAAKYQKQWPFIDKFFTVYDKQHAGSVNINCVARNCLDCGRCYSKRAGKEVYEILKK